MKNNSLTLTVVANLTSNYGESLGNVASVQKVFKNGEIYSMRSRESMKNAFMVQSGMYDDLKVDVDGAAQKRVNSELNVSNCRALEGGYMNTNVGKEKLTFVRSSSFYMTDAIACEPFVNETRFHNNLHLAKTHAKEKGINLQNKAKESGLMPYNYEYDKSLKIYSITFDLEMIGKDENFSQEASSKEKYDRVCSMLDAVENLNLKVKGNLDNSEPIFIVGGIGRRKTHVFENVIHIKKRSLVITDDLADKIGNGYKVGILRSGHLQNENEIIEKFSPVTVTTFFASLKDDIKSYFGV
ncbi:MAG: type I-B CRISPR-associated protein Cas7/Cst2/DevR [Candidatus Cloacimonadota bacterium]|nr:type I-B CRISPR-associated protein Cas7/Cst2/DevR [Candidatus Cloacimonadota bacterium]